MEGAWRRLQGDCGRTPCNAQAATRLDGRSGCRRVGGPGPQESRAQQVGCRYGRVRRRRVLGEDAGREKNQKRVGEERGERRRNGCLSEFAGYEAERVSISVDRTI